MRFSILLPTRNGGDFLENCVRSILEQDHDDFELVISDNANTDSYATDNPRVYKFITNRDIEKGEELFDDYDSDEYLVKWLDVAKNK